ncbi:MAG: AMP-binding protein [Bacteroidota bacterium]
MAKVHFENVSLDISSILNQQNKDFFLSDYEKSILKFIFEWLTKKKQWYIKTSGSTGEPKSIVLSRELMKYSASQTIEALRIKKGSNALLSINANFVGGKMMLVRALENQMNIIIQNPSTQSLKPENLDLMANFAAFVPMQINSFLKDQLQRNALNTIEKVIIGGAPLSYGTISSIQDFKTTFWQTYGMTETYSHVALKQLNGSDKSEYFNAVGDALFSTDEKQRLQICGTITGNELLKTNDIVQLQDEKSFVWTGRYDHVINSGGVKLSPENLEKKLHLQFRDLFDNKNFFISSLPDKNLGEKLVLYVEGEIDEEKLLVEMRDVFHKYEIPKQIISLKNFTYTLTGKINRAASAKKYQE